MCVAIHQTPLEHVGFVIDAVHVSGQCYGDSQLLTLYGEPSIKTDQHPRAPCNRHDATSHTLMSWNRNRNTSRLTNGVQCAEQHKGGVSEEKRGAFNEQTKLLSSLNGLGGVRQPRRSIRLRRNTTKGNVSENLQQRKNEIIKFQKPFISQSEGRARARNLTLDYNRLVMMTVFHASRALIAYLR